MPNLRFIFIAVSLIALPLHSSALTLSAGFNHSLFIGTDGKSKGVGAGSNGQLGNGLATASVALVNASLPAGVSPTATAAGAAHSLTMGSDGKIYAWGLNGTGQLGNGTTQDSSSPVVVSLPAGTVPSGVAAGSYHSLALSATGALYAWGSNGNGQLGLNHTADSAFPAVVTLPGSQRAAKVSAGGGFSLAIGANGSLYGWGQNDVGQLGNGTAAESHVPVASVLPTGITAVDVAAGFAHGLAIGSDHKLYAWGYNGSGQLGNGTRINALSPVVITLPGVVQPVAIAAGANHSLAKGSDGKLYAWGFNGNGELGLGSTTDSLSPVAISFPAGVTASAFAAGDGYSLALGSNNVLYAWGNNAFSQLSTGSTAGSLSPLATATSVRTTPTIAFNPLPNMAMGAGSIALTATASSGLPITYLSLTPAVCTVSGSTLQILAPGRCSVEALQAGSTSAASAVPVIQSFNVTGSTLIPFTPWALWALAIGVISIGWRMGTARGFTIQNLAMAVLVLTSLIGDPAQAALNTFTITVSATDPNGYALSYKWRSTDGRVVDVNSPSTTWTEPGGPGVHFVYVLVSNGHGGYVERRIAMNTDSLGTTAPIPTGTLLKAPPAPVPVGETYQSFVGIDNPDVAMIRARPDLYVYNQDPVSGYRAPTAGFGFATSNLKGLFTIPNLLPSPRADIPELKCGISPAGVFQPCGMSNMPISTDVEPGQAVSDYLERAYIDLSQPPFPTIDVVSGVSFMGDGNPCGTTNEFFGINTTGTATLLDSGDAVISGPVRLSAWGDFTLPYVSGALNLVITCEAAPQRYVPISGPGELGVIPAIPATATPVISAMTSNLATSFLVPLASGPSDRAPEPDKFLAYKGYDSRQGACAYYKAVGAVRNCDAAGNFVGAVTFDDWKRTVKMVPYALPGPTEYQAYYINKVDLNLARNHHSISYSPSQTAAYVCNHLGPSVADPAPAEINTVIDNMVNGKNLVACVAMDYSVSPGVNGGKPYTRFLIFGPSGELLPSVNLDTRREKFVPGTCVVCHGGDHYAGRYQEMAPLRADIGGHFLPYDSGNFEFSTATGLTEANQQLAIYNLNQNVLKAGPTVAAQELIAGWYASGTTLNKNYLPASWANRSPYATDFYHKVIGPSCRGCHVNLAEGYNWDHFDNIETTLYRNNKHEDLFYTVNCDGANHKFRNFGMPNSLITFNRFWSSAGATTVPDQPAVMGQFLDWMDSVTSGYPMQSFWPAIMQINYCAPNYGYKNVALATNGGAASQSSTFFLGLLPASANFANDGDTNGNFFRIAGQPGTSHTNLDTNPWWQVQLGGGNTKIDSIVVWNRTDDTATPGCCSNRINPFTVSVIKAGVTVWSYSVPTFEARGSNDFVFTDEGLQNDSEHLGMRFFTHGVVGDTVKVQISGTNYLHLGEVEVFGTKAP